jgi:hypothetical protein
VTLDNTERKKKRYREEKKEVQRGKKRGNLPHLVVFFCFTCGDLWNHLPLSEAPFLLEKWTDYWFELIPRNLSVF